ncbi:MAG: tetratricopeptide repeat protein [Pirellulales bacterium]
MAGCSAKEVGRSLAVMALASCRWKKSLLAAAVMAVALASSLSASAGTLDEMSLERWAKLREAERYQMNIAEKYFREGQYKVALTEYDKFLSLHEDSEGAPYAQLKWSLCQLQLRKPNAAIKDGFQSVIDYWPESPEAISASYMIGNSYKQMGENKQAKKAYAAVLSSHPQHLVSTLARVDLLDLARIENDTPKRVQLWRELTFEAERKGEAINLCAIASRELATHSFLTGNFAEGAKALATTYPPEQLAVQVAAYARQPILSLTAMNDTKPTGEKVADAAIAWFREHVPEDLKEDSQKVIARQMGYFAADMLDASRRYDEVPAAFEQIIKSYGADDETLGRFGAWYRTQAKYTEARQVYSRFQDPIQGQANSALAYRDEKKHDAAVEIYQRLSGQDADHAAQWLAQAAQTYYEAGKCDECVAVYAGLVGSDGNKTSNWQYAIGNTYRHFGRHKEAIAAYRLCDNFPDCYIQMAFSHRDLGEFKEAINLYQQIVAGYEPQAPWATLQLGYTFEQAGQKESAIKALQRVCKKWPKDPHASQAHVYLNDKFKIRVTLGGGTDD